MLSLFGGAGEPAKAWANEGGKAFVIDIADGFENDLSKPARWNLLVSQVHSFDCIGIDLPCDTWSRARRAPKHSRFPHPLRGEDPESVLGLPGLKKSDAEKVMRANQMMWGACKLIRRAFRCGVCGYLENPLSSRLWKAPCIRRLLQDHRIFEVKLDFCQYGTQWKKPTKLLVWGVPPFQLLRCKGKSTCSRTKKPHLVLTGLAGKRFLTEHAQVYPKLFGEALAQSLLAHSPSRPGH